MRKQTKNRVGRSSRMAWVAKLPWWLCFAAAAGGWYYAQSLVGDRPQVAIRSLSDIQPAAAVMAPWAAAYIGQYVVPGFFGLAGVASFLRRWTDRRLVRKVMRNPKNLARGMDWREFEKLVAEAFRRQGYSVTMTEAGADGGVDVVLRRGGKKAYCQCKQYKTSKVGVAVVRELYGVMASEGVDEGFVVTCGTFTEAAKDFAHGLNITLVDYYDLCDWFGVDPY